MKTTIAVRTVVVCLFALTGVAWAGPAQQAKSPAAPLFEQALRADADGQTKLRADLLREALRLDPEFQLARWHLGQVFFQGKWRSILNVGQLVSHDPRWQEYQGRVAALDDSPQAHAALARWCHDQGLESEDKWHWTKVLQADPDHREALGSLGLKRYQGGLYTEQQIAELRERQEQAEKDFKRFRRQFKRLVSLAERGTPEQHAHNMAEIAAVNDPAAVDALMHVVVNINSKESRLIAKLGKVDAEQFIAEVSQAVIAALGNMPEHQATLKLVEIAVLAPQAEVRHSAAEALRYRPQTSYMPLLMASLAAPVESSFSIDVSANGLVTVVEDFYEEGPLSDTKHVRSSGFSTHSMGREREIREPAHFALQRGQTQRGNVRVSIAEIVPNTRQDFQEALAHTSSTQQELAAENEVREVRNARIQEVLEITTDQQLGSDPKAWWTAWQQFNELGAPDETPLYETFEEYGYAGPDVYPGMAYRVRTSCSCFVAGTTVWTQSGPRPIEQIGVGEMVLSQDPISGRLDYRPVVATTIRPPSPVVKLTLEDETIVATRGHRFWVAGHGWRMAKFLSAGNALFGGKGSVDLGSVAEGKDQPAYNLVVGEFHTYFVGRSRLLVHDNNCPQPTTATVPGAQSFAAE